MLRIDWPYAEHGDYSDYIPLHIFATEGERVLKHTTMDSHGHVLNALCLVTVKGALAQFDYAASGDIIDNNNLEDVYLGQMEIEFDDSRRQEPIRVSWFDHDDPATDWPGFAILDEVGKAALEGRSKLATHLRYERDQSLAKEKKRLAKAEHGRLICEACGFDGKQYAPLDLGNDPCFEVHHTWRLADRGPRITTVDDLSILCANCHQAIHKLENLMSIDEFRQLVRA